MGQPHEDTQVVLGYWELELQERSRHVKNPSWTSLAIWFLLVTIAREREKMVLLLDEKFQPVMQRFPELKSQELPFVAQFRFLLW